MIEATLAERFPEVELVDLEVRGGPTGTLTLFVDRPGGVDLELCAAVSQALDDVRERYVARGVVTGPGPPAAQARAFRRGAGPRRRRQAGGATGTGAATSAASSRRPTPTSVTLDLADGGSVTLPLVGIAKAHVVYNFDTDGGHRE